MQMVNWNFFIFGILIKEIGVWFLMQDRSAFSVAKNI